jgi:hypothetical protein
MAEVRAVILIFVGAILLTAVAVLSMAALGVRGVVLSLGAIGPAALAADGVARVVMHYGESGRRQR